MGTRTSEVVATCATSQTNRKDVACSIASKELVQKTGTECDECKAEDDNVCLLDMDEVELESVLSRNGTQMDKGFIDISALEFFLTDTEEPEKNSTCNRHVTMKGKLTYFLRWASVMLHVAFSGWWKDNGSSKVGRKRVCRF